jgi:hypothetical protein
MRASLAVALLVAAAAGPAQAARFEQLVVSHKRGVYSLRAVMLLDAPPAAVRDSMLDFEHLHLLSEAILESRRMRDLPKGAVVYTRSRGCIGFFCRDLRKTETVEVQGDSIQTRTIAEQSNVIGTARWTIEAAGASTRVRWESDVDPQFFVPPLLGPPLMKRALKREGEALAAGLERAAQQRARGKHRG